MTDIELHVAFGPVQSFVSQARTTRDLWAGSFMLSLLSRYALYSACETKPPPQPIKPYIDDVRGLTRALSPEEARVGLTPNLFEFRVVNEQQAVQVANNARKAWFEEWSKIVEASMRAFGERMGGAVSKECAEIWKKQTGSLWECYWATGPYINLSRRKMIRDFIRQPENGEKCTICGEREVLRDDDASRKGVHGFWEVVAQWFGSVKGTETGNERLCGVCMTKRLAPEVLQRLYGSDMSRFPSTTSFSTLPWILGILDSTETVLERAAGAYLSLLNERFPGEAVVEWGRKQGRETELSALLRFDGDFFLPESYEVGRTTTGTEAGDREILRALGNLYDAARKSGIGTPDSYYAILAMDGDNMGVTLSTNPERKREISSSLKEFAETVFATLQENWGRLIYAGGDDVFAMLPTTTVLDTAGRICRDFRKAMQHLNLEKPPTISAGIAIAHMSSPLKSIVTRAQSLLHEYAKKHVIKLGKDGTSTCGKDAFAVELWDRGGPSRRLVKKWNVHPSDTAGLLWTEEMSDLTRKLDDTAVIPLTSGFLYSSSELLRRISSSQFDESETNDLLLAEYLRSRDKRIRGIAESDDKREAAREIIRRLISLAKDDTSDEVKYNPDAVTMLKFFSRGGGRM